MSICRICGKPEGRGFDGLQIQQCDRCDEESCADCVECDYDLVGDPGSFVCRAWTCRKCLDKESLERR